MKFLPGDLKKLRISLLTSLLMIGMGTATVFFANGAIKSAQRERVAAQAASPTRTTHARYCNS